MMGVWARERARGGPTGDRQPARVLLETPTSSIRRRASGCGARWQAAGTRAARADRAVPRPRAGECAQRTPRARRCSMIRRCATASLALWRGVSSGWSRASAA